MPAYRIHLIALLISITAFGCGTNSNNCPGGNANNCADGGPNACTDSAGCATPTGVCKLDIGTCVQCTPDESAACSDVTPVCGADNKCRGCVAHTECESRVCLPDGRCSAEGSINEVAYVRPGGYGDECTKAIPCGLLSAALRTSRPFIKMTGILQDKITVKDQSVTILADTNATLSGRGVKEETLIRVEGAANLIIYDLTISESESHGIAMITDNTSTVSVHRVKLLDNAKAGINADGGTLNVFQSIVAQNDGGGINTGGATLNVSQSTIARNDGGGILVEGGTVNVFQSTIAENQGGGINMNSATTFDIRNNFIVRNGNLLSAIAGGVRAVPAGSSKFEFNTVVGNKALSTAVSSAGLACTSAIAAPYNLVFDNSLSGAVDEQIAVCGRDQSLRIEPPAGAGFKAPNNNDYHLTASTAADILDKVACSGNMTDVDGDTRPQGDLCDFGADEYRPTGP